MAIGYLVGGRIIQYYLSICEWRVPCLNFGSVVHGFADLTRALLCRVYTADQLCSRDPGGFLYRVGFLTYPMGAGK
jgi:hypothetical protein